MNVFSRLSPAAWAIYSSLFAAFYLGCLGCFLLQAHVGFSPILAAASLGFAVTFVPLPARVDAKSYQLAFCTGTFVGMSSSQIIASPLQVLLASLVGGVIYLLARPHFAGLGGKLGAIAFVATAVWLLLRVTV